MARGSFPHVPVGDRDMPRGVGDRGVVVLHNTDGGDRGSWTAATDGVDGYDNLHEVVVVHTDEAGTEVKDAVAVDVDGDSGAKETQDAAEPQDATWQSCVVMDVFHEEANDDYEVQRAARAAARDGDHIWTTQAVVAMTQF